MPSPDACEQCVATLSRNEQKNARHDGAMARWRDGAMARWRDGRILRQSFGPVPFHEKMAEICGCERSLGSISVESTDSDSITPGQNSRFRSRSQNHRSQPQISAIFPYLGTRFPKKDGVQHGKTCKTQKGQSPTRENMPSQKGQGLTQQDKRLRKRPVLNPRRRTSFRKAQSSSKDTFAPKRAMRVRGSMRLKNDVPFITQTRKWVATGTDAFIRHILCSISPILEKSAMTAP